MKLGVLLIAFFVGVSIQASGKWMIDGKARVYQGQEGVQVTILSLRPRSDNQVLVAFEGTSSKLDGKVLLHKMVGEGKSQDFKTEFEGQMRTTIAAGSAWWRSKQLYLGVPGGRNNFPIYYSEEESKKAPSQSLLNRFLSRKSKPLSGKYNRKNEIQAEEKQFSQMMEMMNMECKAQIKGHVDWSTIKDDVLKNLHVAEACGQLVTTLSDLCDDQVGQEAVSGAIKNINCKVGTKLGITLSKGMLSWTTALDTPSQQSFAYKYLNDKL